MHMEKILNSKKLKILKTFHLDNFKAVDKEIEIYKS